MTKTERYSFIDLLKGFAMIVMIEVHIFNEMALPWVKKSDWFTPLNFINGLVAPSFVFVSGFAFMIASSRKLENLTKLGKYFWKQITRIVFLFIAGYSLHIPFLSLKNMIIYCTPKNFEDFYKFDVLQCIAFGLLLLLILRVFIKNNRIFLFTIYAFTLGFIFLTPFVWNTNFDYIIPIPISTILNKDHGSLFPIFPWLGFLFAGALFSLYFIESTAKNDVPKYIKKVLLIGVSFIVVFHLGNYLHPILLNSGYKSNPCFMLLRLGYVLTLLSSCYYLSLKVNFTNSVFLKVSQESLLVYWFHLQFMYRDLVGGRSLVGVFRSSLGVTEVFLMSLALIAFMIIFAKIWSDIKSYDRNLSNLLSKVFIAGMFLLFLTN